MSSSGTSEPPSANSVGGALFSSIKSRLTGAAVGLLELYLLTFLLPFQLEVFAVLLVVVVLCIVLMRFVVIRGRRLSAYAVILVTSVIGAVWLIIGPLVVAAEPLYVFEEKRYDPRASVLIPLDEDRPASGTIFRVADPIRNRFADWFGALGWMDVRRFEAKEFGTDQFLDLPNRFVFRFKESTIAETAYWTELVVPRIDRRLQIGFDLEIEGDQRSIALNIAPGMAFGSFIRWSYVESKTRPSWTSIAVGEAIQDDDLRYAAHLSQVLDAISLGETEIALNELLIASELTIEESERARLFTIFGELAESRLGGKLGRIQALLYFNEAFDAIVRHAVELSPYRRLPSVSWTISALKVTYRQYGQIYANRVAELERLSEFSDAEPDLVESRPKDFEEHFFRGDASAAFDAVWDFLRSEVNDVHRGTLYGKAEIEALGLEGGQFVETVEREGCGEGMRGELLIYLRLLGRQRSAILEMQDALLSGKAIGAFDSLELGASEAKQMARAVELCPPESGRFFLQILNDNAQIRAIFPMAHELPDLDTQEGEQRYFDRLTAFFGYVGMDKYAKMLQDMKDGAGPQTVKPQDFDITSVNWWSSEFLQRFLFEVLQFQRMGPELDAKVIQNATAMVDLEHDRGGKGAIFLPWVAFLSWQVPAYRDSNPMAQQVEGVLGAPLAELSELPPRE